jgi:histidinol-phosphate phosphatase family protein
LSDRAVFLDRDGVINRRRPDHVKSWSEFQFLPGSLAAIRALREMGEHVVVVTNQSVVGRGMISETALLSIHRRMIDAVEQAGGSIAGVYACLHSPERGCECRKPQIGLLVSAADELGIRLRDSVLVGDSPSDVEAARSAGCKAIFVGGSPATDRVGDAEPARDLREAVSLISRASSYVRTPC